MSVIVQDSTGQRPHLSVGRDKVPRPKNRVKRPAAWRGLRTFLRLVPEAQNEMCNSRMRTLRDSGEGGEIGVGRVGSGGTVGGVGEGDQGSNTLLEGTQFECINDTCVCIAVQ
jgi:hypothetical protein